MTGMGVRSGRVWTIAVLTLTAPTVGCASQPADIRLSAIEPGAEEMLHAGAPADDLPVTELDHDGILGGRITARMPAAPDRVVAHLLDFDTADGHRAWARHYSTISRDGPSTVAEWQFEGKLGIDPTVRIEFLTRDEGQRTVIDFRIVESGFGLAAFFGDYTIEPEATGADASLLVMRVFIDSGLPFVNASAEDIAAGLRADVRMLREWLEVTGPDVSASTPRSDAPCGGHPLRP